MFEPEIEVWDRYFDSNPNKSDVGKPAKFNGHKWVVDMRTEYGDVRVCESDDEDGTVMVDIPDHANVEEVRVGATRCLKISLMGLPKMDKLWVIQANVVRTDDHWTGSTGVPTFYLDPDVQMIEDAAHACMIAKGVIDPFNLLEVYVSAIALDMVTGLTVESSYATLGPKES